MLSTIKGTLPLANELSPSAQQAFSLDSLKTGTLISLAQLCDDDCIALFSRYEVKIIKHDKVIITGRRMSNGLWSIPIADTPLHQANGILRTDKVKSELARFHHATMGGPVPSTLLRAIRRGHLATFPGMTTNLISKHLPKSLSTTLGHQDQEAKNLRSTKPIAPSLSPSPPHDEDLAPALAPRTNQTCAMLLNQTDLTRSYSDQTGRFPVPSSRGNNYLFVLYHQDTNTIHAVPIPNRQAASIRNAWESTHKLLVRHGHPTDLHVLDNECSDDLKQAFEKHNIQFQRVPPHEHRVNAAERAIRTYKNHFVTILCNADPAFPLSEWDRLVPQATLTLNLLRSSRIHPSMSAHASLFGNFDFNRTPMAPPGTKVVVHLNSETRPPFGEHGLLGWYIGPALEHYRCYKCYLPETRQERNVLTVDFFPNKTPFPTFTKEAYLQQTAEDMLHLLQPTADTSAVAPLAFGPPILNAFTKVAQLLGRATRPPPTIVPTAPPRAATPDLLDVAPVAPPRVFTTDPVSPPRVPPQNIVPTSPPKASRPTIAPRVSRDITNLAPAAPAPRVNFASDATEPLHRTRSFTRLQARHLAQSVQHDPTIAGKMYDPVTGRAETIDSLLRGPDRLTWLTSLANEWARCTTGLSKNRTAATAIKGNQTMVIIKPHQVPPGRTVTYANFVCTMRPGKTEVYRLRMTIGGDRLEAFQDVRSPAVGIVDTKLHLNSTISDADKGARYATCDIKDFFLGSKMKVFQYMKIHRRYVPQEISDEYNITDADFDRKGYIYLEIQKGMYGLKEASILAYEQLVAHLAPYGYSPMPFTPGLWRHSTRRTTFTLAVDDFGVKHFSKADAEHLFNALRDKYTITTDWTGSTYLGLTLAWNYAQRWVDVSMPDYVPNALARLGHKKPKIPQHAPHQWSTPVYGRKIQLAHEDLTPLLDKLGIKRVQQISGIFLYYGRAVDQTIIVALNEISNSQACPTEQTARACNMLLDYLATHPDATIRYYASDMILCVISDAAYLVLPKARSRAAGTFFLTNKTDPKDPKPTPNGAVHVLCKTLKGVPSSAAEAETGGLFLNAQEAVPLRTALLELGHQQPTTGTPLETDNSTAHDILRAKVRMKRSKAFDMRYHWLKDRVAQGHFNLYWAAGKNNRADYYSKHFPPSYHQRERYQPGRLQRPPQQQMINLLTTHLRGCVSPHGSHIQMCRTDIVCPSSVSDRRSDGIGTHHPSSRSSHNLH